MLKSPQVNCFDTLDNAGEVYVTSTSEKESFSNNVLAAGRVVPSSAVPPAKGVYVLVPGQVSLNGPFDINVVLSTVEMSYQGTAAKPSFSL